MAYTWQKVANDWSTLTDTQKIALFEGTDYNIPTGAELMALNDIFKVAIYDVSDTGQQLAINGIPKGQIIEPNNLLNTSAFVNINKITIGCNLTGSGIIKVAATNDLTNYKVYNTATNSWDVINLVSDIATLGMTPSDVLSLSQSHWTLLDVSGGVAFAFYLDITNPVDGADVDYIQFEGFMNDFYRSQIKGTVYDYDYIGDNTIRVYLYDSGKFKINYPSSSGI